MPLPKTVEEFAPAKLNLALHVTGRRADGYHLLDSLVAFAGIGDRLTVHAAKQTVLNVSGPFSVGVPSGSQNLVMRAARLFNPHVETELNLVKNLPSQAGIGGGSSDSAACLRALATVTDRGLPSVSDVLQLGADVPVCIAMRPARMRGIGEQIEPLILPADVWAVLVNPGVAVPTPDVFKSLKSRDNPPLPAQIPIWKNARELSAWLCEQRNDLEDPATKLAPSIATCLQALRVRDGCLIARMSGSGATCFGLFAAPDDAKAVAMEIQKAHPSWWCVSTPLLS